MTLTIYQTYNIFFSFTNVLFPLLRAVFSSFFLSIFLSILTPSIFSGIKLKENGSGQVTLPSLIFLPCQSSVLRRRDEVVCDWSRKR